VIRTNLVFANNHQVMSAFMRDFQHVHEGDALLWWEKQSGKKAKRTFIVDMSVYKKNQQLRTAFSSKLTDISRTAFTPLNKPLCESETNTVRETLVTNIYASLG
jgi:hypothetical protein